jgi:uncharacterized protein (DUF1800 family)
MQPKVRLTPQQKAAWSPFSLLLAATFVSGCGFHLNVDPTAISVPSSTVHVNQTLQIKNPAPAWPLNYYVNGVLAGNSTLGNIASNGLFTAPAVVPEPNSVTITASSTFFPQYSPGSAAISILNPIPLINSITPGTLSEGTTTIIINGSQFIYGAQILWNGSPVPTTYVSGNQLAASITAPTPGTYPLEVDNPAPGPANSTPISIAVGPGQVVLADQPLAGTTVRVSNTLRFNLIVSGTSNTSMNMQVNGIAGGNAQLGTIVPNSDGTFTYTAPPVVPTPKNVVQLSLTSVDNSTVSLIQNIAVLNPIPVLTGANPMSFNIGPSTIVLTGSSFINGAQVLVNGASVPTSFDNGGQLTASINPTVAGNLDLQVLNPGPGPATSTDLIATVNGTPPASQVSPEEASRFLAQATFGATDADIRHVSNVGYAAWLNEQFNMPQTLQEPSVEQALILNNAACTTGIECNAALFVQNSSGQNYVANSFWQQALTGNDQLRQRMTYTLNEVYVISGQNGAVGNMPRGMANYYDVLGADAFANFRQLLQDITLNPMMGQFLSVQGNDKGDATRDPDENYAREVMQLFTIGLYQLNADGTQKLDNTGTPIPTYSNNDVMGLAKVFTGFSWNIPGDSSDNAWSQCCVYVGTGFGEDILPMQSFPNHHSTEEKDFLGVTIQTQGAPDPNGDLKVALDTLFNHANTPPFVCKQLIQHLVTSNPSPAYVSRVTAVFRDNGSGVRGDMKAVIQAILLDDEARNASNASSTPQFGKVRESLLRYTEWARAFTAQSRNGSFLLNSTEDPIQALGEMPLRSPTVFNWFAPGYVPPGTSISQAGLLAPEMQMTDVSTVVGYLNYMQDAIGADATRGPDIYSNYGAEIAIADMPDQLVDRINLLLMAGEMDSNLRGEIISAVGSIPVPGTGINEINAALSNRVKTAIYLTMAAPSYSAQY